VQEWRIHRSNDRLIKNLSEYLKSGDYKESIGACVGSGKKKKKKCRSHFKIPGTRKET
jgi:hypothetical protein